MNASSTTCAHAGFGACHGLRTRLLIAVNAVLFVLVLTWMAISMIWLLVDLIFTIVRLSITGWGGYGIILTLELFGAIFLSLGIYGAWKYKFSLVKLYSTIMFIVAFIEFGGIVTISWGRFYLWGFVYLCDVLLRIYLAWRAYTLANIYKRCEIEHFRANGLISAV